jgi:integrase
VWAREQELEVDQKRPQVHRMLKCITVANIVCRYRDEVVPRKRGADRETLTLNAFLRQPLARVALSEETAGMVSAYCAERLRRVKPGTLNRELDILRHAFATARRDWDLPLASNAFANVTRPKGGPPRERRLRLGEQDHPLFACGRCRNPHVRFLVQLAVETAMRRSEILNMRWHDLSVETRTLTFRSARTGMPGRSLLHAGHWKSCRSHRVLGCAMTSAGLLDVAPTLLRELII